MNKTWKPVTAGILDIVSGGLHALGAIAVIIALAATSCNNSTLYFAAPHDWLSAGPRVTAVLIICLVFMLIATVFPIIGGVYALQRKKWGWALAGSIIAMAGTLPLGILATIFVSIGKDEFE